MTLPHFHRFAYIISRSLNTYHVFIFLSRILLTRYMMLDYYQCLHEMGIVHHDVSPDNWLKRGTNQLSIIDFDRAITRSTYDSEAGELTWEGLCDRELRAVKSALGIVE
jgi:serine/threonine protein kinase